MKLASKSGSVKKIEPKWKIPCGCSSKNTADKSILLRGTWTMTATKMTHAIQGGPHPKHRTQAEKEVVSKSCWKKIGRRAQLWCRLGSRSWSLRRWRLLILDCSLQWTVIFLYLESQHRPRIIHMGSRTGTIIYYLLPWLKCSIALPVLWVFYLDPWCLIALQ